MTTLRVAALVPYALDTTPSQRFRLEQWAPHLAEQGVDVSFLPFADESLTRLLRQSGQFPAKVRGILGAWRRQGRRLKTIDRVDAYVVHRAASLVGPPSIERRLARSGIPLVYDFDDAIYELHTSSVNRGFGWLKFPRKTAQICEMSRAVTVGNAFLADFARRYSRSVHVVPTSVDTARFRPRTEGNDGRMDRPSRTLVVGWAGSSTSQAHLEAHAEVLAEAQRRYRFELRVVSDRRPDLPGVVAAWRPWSREREVDEIADFDIGIMPMPDDAWSRGKCALKALLYMAMGLPTIVSPVGTNREVVEDGTNGLWAGTADEWLDAFGRLVDRDERQRLGLAARRTVEEQYSARVCAARFGAVLREAAAEP
jgi:glycosyltransferase involved in cell wall biosynthesis